MKKLEEIIGYEFQNEKLLKTALTHSSFLNEHGLDKTECNERLEFLGDAVLETISSEFLFKNYPENMEGDLSRMRSALVCEKSLCEASRSLQLGAFLRLGKGMEKEGGRNNDAVLADAFEALLAALFLDGGMEVAKKLVYSYVLNDTEEKILLNDAKTRLQEMIQKEDRHVSYRLLSASGPDHQKSFTCQALINDEPFGTGTGSSKKQAEQAAAYETIKMIRNNVTCI